MSQASPIQFDQIESVAKIGINVMGAPWACYAEAWGVGAKAKNDTPPNPLSAGLDSISKLTDDSMQSQIDEALKQSIY